MNTSGSNSFGNSIDVSSLATRDLVFNCFCFSILCKIHNRSNCLLNHNTPSMKLFQVLSLLVMLFSLLLCFKTTTWSTTKIQSCVPSPEVQERLLLCLPSVCQRLHESVPAAESFCSKTKKAASAVTAFMTSQLKVLECPPCRTAAIGLCWPH